MRVEADHGVGFVPKSLLKNRSTSAKMGQLPQA
jgi:hypothetical protein